METLTQLHLTLVHPDSIIPAWRGCNPCFPFPWNASFCSLVPMVMEFHYKQQVLLILAIQLFI